MTNACQYTTYPTIAPRNRNVLGQITTVYTNHFITTSYINNRSLKGGGMGADTDMDGQREIIQRGRIRILINSFAKQLQDTLIRHGVVEGHL